MTHTEPAPSTAQYKLASLDIYVVEVLAQEETLVHAVQVGRGQVRRALGRRSRRARSGLLCIALGRRTAGLLLLLLGFGGLGRRKRRRLRRKLRLLVRVRVRVRVRVS